MIEKLRHPVSDTGWMAGTTSTEAGASRKPSPRAFITASLALHTSVARSGRSLSGPLATNARSLGVR